MSFVDQAMLQDSQTPNPGGALQSGMQQGIQNGIEIAKQRQSWMQTNMELQLKKQQLDQQKAEHVTGLFDKAAEAYKTDPALGDVLMTGAGKTAQTLNVPVDPDFMDTFKKSAPLRDWYQKQLDSMDPTAPDYLQKRSQVLSEGYVDPDTGRQMPGLSKVIGGSALQTAAEHAAQPVIDLKKSQMMADAIAGKPQAETSAKAKLGIVQSASKNMQAGYATPQDIQAVADGHASPEQYAQVWKQGSEQNARDAVNATHKTQAETDKANADAKVVQQRADEQARHNKQMEILASLRTHLQVSKESQGILDKSLSDTKQDRESLKTINEANGLLQPGATVNQVNMAAQAMERAVTGSARVAATTYNGIKLEDAWANTQKALAKWRLMNPNDAQVPDGILQNYKNISNAIQKATQDNITKTAAQYVGGGVRNKLMSQSEGKAIIDNLSNPAATDKFLDSIGYHGPATAPGGSALKPVSPALLQGLRQKIQDPVTLKNFLIQNNYDSSGVK